VALDEVDLAVLASRDVDQGDPAVDALAYQLARPFVALVGGADLGLAGRGARGGSGHRFSFPVRLGLHGKR
jgi:hypothetical protein